MLTPCVQASARLRKKNQLTLPAPVANAIGARPNDLLVFEANPAEPNTVIVRRMPRSFAGAMPGVDGTTRDVIEFIRAEHATWND